MKETARNARALRTDICQAFVKMSKNPTPLIAENLIRILIVYV